VLPANILRRVKHGPRGGSVDLSWQPLQVCDERLDQFVRQALSLLAHQKGVEDFVTPESRNGGLVAQGNPLGNLFGFLSLFVGKTPS
jgi:hypothetical protein